MSNLDDILGMRALEEMQSRLRELLDPRSWTLENRDAAVEAVTKTALDISAESSPITLQLLTQEIDGKSFLMWNMQTQVLGALIEFLEQARRDLDWLTPEERMEISVDNEWLTTKIRDIVLQYKEAKTRVDQTLTALKSESLVESQEI